MTTTTLYACVICGTPSNHRRCPAHGGRNTRPSPWTRGYQREFVRNRKQLLKEEPACRLCGDPASVAHHDPPRRVLIATGVTNPDGLEWLRPLCDRCHRNETAKGR